MSTATTLSSRIRPSSSATRPWVLASETLATDGGGERMIERTALALRSHRPVRILPLFEGGAEGRTARSLRSADIPVDEIALFPHRLTHPRDLWPHRHWSALTKYLVDHRIGAVVSYSVRGALRLVRPCRRAGVPLLVSLHQSAPFFGEPGARLKRLLAGRELRGAVTKWIVLSSRARDELSCWGMPIERIDMIPNGIDLELWSPQAVPRPAIRKMRAELGSSDNDFVIGSLARLHPLKNLSLAITALARLRDLRPLARLVIAGGPAGDAPNHLEELRAHARRSGVEACVQFAGHLPDPRAFLAACDVLLQPSRQEASPLSILEALALERPVVATSVGGVSELLGNGAHGWLVPSDDASAMRLALEEIHDKPSEARRRGLLGRQFVASHHDWSRTAERLDSSISDVARP